MLMSKVLNILVLIKKIDLYKPFYKNCNLTKFAILQK